VNKLNLFFRLSKVDIEKRLVTGIATAESVDKSGEICDYATTVPYYKAWSNEFSKATQGGSLGNLRSMHSAIAAGKIVEVFYNDAAKSIEITAKVVDDAEWNKVVENVYTGFSQGGEYIDRWPDPENPKLMRYTANPSEVSLVDNPCLGIATFEVIKANGQVEVRKLKSAGEPMKELTQGWQAKDGTFFVKKSEAEKRNAEISAAALAKEAGAAADAVIDDLNKKLGVEEYWLEKKKFSDEKRKELADSGAAMKDGSFPIEDKEDLKNAIQAHGRAKDPDAAKEHIKTRAKAIGAEDLLPDDWKDGKDDKMDEAAKTTGAVETADEPMADGKDKDDENKDTATKFNRGAMIKSLWDVGRVAGIIEDLEWTRQCLEQESAWEGDDSPQPAKLKECIASLGAFLVSLVTEEVDEVTGGTEADYAATFELAVKLPADSARAVAKAFGKTASAGNKRIVGLIEALEKAGARHSKDDAEHLATLSGYVATIGEHLDKMAKAHAKAEDAHDEIQKCHDGMDKCMKSLGIDPDVTGGKEVEDEDTHGKPDGDKDPAAEKMVKMAMENQANTDALKGVIDRLTAQLDTVNKRLSVVEKEPVTNPKGVIGAGIVQKRNGIQESGDESVDAETPVNIRPAGVSPMEYKRQTSR